MSGFPQRTRFFFFPLSIQRYLMVGNDTWFLLNGGRFVLENGIPYTEPYTIS
jgi:hypothetical protein